MSVESLLLRVFGQDDPVLNRFKALFDKGNRLSYFTQQIAIFRSAMDQFEGGHLFDICKLIHADVFSDELEQATYFLKDGHSLPAAVIAGTVLETTLRELCEQHPDLEPAKADKMISDLAKEAVFNKMRADQLRAWMKTRNSAVHGKPEEYDEVDVRRMIDGIGDFVANHMS